MIHLQSNYKQQIVTDGNPYLCEDCILGRPIERLDVQVLLDPFEECLDSPALPIQFSNGNCLKFEVIRQESIHYVLHKSGYFLAVKRPVRLMSSSEMTPVCLSTSLVSNTVYLILSFALVTK